MEGKLSLNFYSFHFLTIAPIVHPSKLLAYCSLVCPSFVQIYNLVPGVLRQLVGLGQGGKVAVMTV